MVNASQRSPSNGRLSSKIYRLLTVLVNKSCGETHNRLSCPLIHFENVGLRYGMGPEILRDLTFDIEEILSVSDRPIGRRQDVAAADAFHVAAADTRPDPHVRARHFRNPRPELPLLRRRVGIVFRISACSTISPPMRMSLCPYGCAARMRAPTRPTSWNC